MAMSLEPSFEIDDMANSACSFAEHKVWHLLEGNEVVLSGEGIHSFVQIRKEPNSSATTTSRDTIDDLLTRRRIWEKLFGIEAMPTSEKGSLEKSFGLLDSCFQSKGLKGEEVLELLKKAK
jgi:hypothetical protein